MDGRAARSASGRRTSCLAAVLLTVSALLVVLSGRAPGALAAPSSPAHTQIGLFRDGHAYGPLPFATADTGWPAPGSLNFGQTGDRYLQLDQYSHCAMTGPMGCRSHDWTTTGATVVRPDPRAGLRWYQQYVCASSAICSGEATGFIFGNVGDLPLVMVWAGHRVPVVFRPSTGQWFIATGYAQSVVRDVVAVTYGSPGDVPVVGDWTGSGQQTPAVFRAGRFYELDTVRSGGADRVVPFGNPGDVPLAGDWNGDGVTTPGVYRAGRWFLTDSRDASQVAFVFDDGTAQFQPTTYP